MDENIIKTATAIENVRGYKLKWHVTRSLEMFESDVIRKKLLAYDKEGKQIENDDNKKVLSEHSLTVKFDYTDVLIEEVLLLHNTDTTVKKMFRNNVYSTWNEAKILAECETSKKTAYPVKVRELLDGRKRETKPDVDKTADKLRKLDPVKLAEEIAKYKAMLADLEAVK